MGLYKIRLLDIADVERAVKGKVYPGQTIYIQVSACRRTGYEQFKRLEKEGELESKYAVIIPKIRIFPEYFQLSLENSVDEWMHRYVGTNINIQMEAFKYLNLYIHDDLKVQENFVANIHLLDNQIKAENQQIEWLGEVKQYFLEKLFPGREAEKEAKA